MKLIHADIVYSEDREHLAVYPDSYIAVEKGKAPQIKERAIKIASDPKVQRAALEVADIAKEGIRHRKTRRVIGVLIRAARK